MNTKFLSFNLPPKHTNHISLVKSHATQLSFNTNFKKSHYSIEISAKPYGLSVKAAGAALHAAPAQLESFYDLLGVTKSVGQSDIKKAFKKMALKYHPDVSPPDRIEENTTKFIRVQEAYEILSDPEARATYDINLSLGFSLSGRMGTRSDHMDGWKSRWQVQIMELKKKSVMDCKVDPKGRVSWGARIRNKRSKPSA